MNLLNLLAIGAEMATILGIFITILGLNNNRVIKSGIAATQDLIHSTQDLIKEEMAANRSLLEKIEQGQENTIKYLGDLIVADGERTRQAIKELKPS